MKLWRRNNMRTLRLIDTPSYPRPFTEAVNGAFSALFEGLNPSQKTRRAIRNLIQPPPDGWDSPAQTPDGTEVVSRRGNVLSWIVALETYIRDTFLHDPNVNEKFEPGIARIAYNDLGLWPENVEDYTDTPRVPCTEMIPQFRSIIRMLSGAHADEYDFDLNGMTLQDMVARFGKVQSAEDYDDTEDTGHTDYEIVRIDSFAEAEKYSDCWNNNPRSRWCIVDDPSYFRRYTKRGKNTQYFLLAPGYKDVPPVPGPDAPKDKYGLSMIGVTVGPTGTVEDCCTRWNHSHGGTDHSLTKQELSQILGRPFSLLCPPADSSEERNPSYLTAAAINRRLDAGEKPDQIFNPSKLSTPGILGGSVAMYSVECDDADRFIILDKDTMRPIWNLELYDYTGLDEDCIMGTTLGDDTDEFGDDVREYWLLRRDGAMCKLGSSDYDDEDTLLGEEITDACRFGPLGVYLLKADNRDDAYITLVTRDFKQITGWQYDIDLYEEDHIIACDLDREYDRYDRNGSPYVLWYHEGEYSELIGPSANSRMGDNGYGKIYVEIPEKKRINIIFQTADRVFAIIHGNMSQVGNDGVQELDRVDRSNLDGILSIGYEGDIYDIINFKADPPRIVQSGLIWLGPGGVYRNEDGTMNILDDYGEPFFDHDWAKIDTEQMNNRPIDEWFINLHDGKGNVYCFDVSRMCMVYDRPLPEGNGICPYTEELYVRELENGKHAIFSLDGQQRSPEFERFMTNPCTTLSSVVTTGGDVGGENIKAIVDVSTGKFLATDIVGMTHINTAWPKATDILQDKACKLPLFKQYIMRNAAIYLLERTDSKAKYTIAASLGGVWLIAPFGWLPHLPKLPFGLPLVGLELDDNPGPDGDYKVYYDLNTGRILPWHKKDIMTLLVAYTKDKLACELTRRGLPSDDNTKNLYISRAIGSDPDWIDHINEKYAGRLEQ